ncbi:MAG: Fic family protein [Candidatus Moranbacteria bacterium]|nr:Fic family protein [Candidatus Moranbacteria bacterium]
MNSIFSKRLQKIRQAADITQEKIATELGVSFATVNSWINNRSYPRQKHQELINKLYEFYVAGKETIPPGKLEEKKSRINKKAIRYQYITDLITNRRDLKDQFLLLLTYNTNRIEGSTMTREDTAAVLFDNQSLANHSLVEQMEAKNHQSAFNYILTEWMNSKKRTTDSEEILNLHQMLMNGILSDAGHYRDHSVRIVGANIPTANWQSVPQKMNKLIKEINHPRSGDTIHRIAQIHAQFEQIHPFSDGNGRIGRLLMNMMAFQKDLPPIIIENSRKRVYYKYLQKAQLEEKYNFLEDLVCDSLLESYKIIENLR